MRYDFTDALLIFTIPVILIRAFEAVTPREKAFFFVLAALGAIVFGFKPTTKVKTEGRKKK